MTTGPKSLSTLVTALMLFGLAGSIVLATIPRLSATSQQPTFAVFLGAGVAVIILTAGLFGYIDRLGLDRKSTRLNSSHANISYAVFCLKQKTLSHLPLLLHLL